MPYLYHNIYRLEYFFFTILQKQLDLEGKNEESKKPIYIISKDNQRVILGNNYKINNKIIMITGFYFAGYIYQIILFSEEIQFTLTFSPC